jgi:hypothetical protein
LQTQNKLFFKIKKSEEIIGDYKLTCNLGESNLRGLDCLVERHFVLERLATLFLAVAATTTTTTTTHQSRTPLHVLSEVTEDLFGDMATLSSGVFLNFFCDVATWR